MQMREINVKEESFVWGICTFGDQKTPPSLCFPELKTCRVLQSFMDDELNSLIDISTENVLYSSKENLRASACDFWCAILSFENEVDLLPIKIDWFPSYSELKIALENYGFLFNFSSNTDSAPSNSARRGPAPNIRAWLKFVTASCQKRNKMAIYLTSEAEELIKVIICLFSDRQLQGLSVLLHECMQSAISYFTEKEWDSSCEKIANSLACRVPKDVTCLRIVECISGVDTRSKLFRSAIAHQMLLSCYDHKAPNDEEILKLLIPVNVKDKKCDFSKMYIHLVLAENWLLSSQLVEDKPVLKAMWRLYLRNCSCLIASTDLRSFASKGMFALFSLLTSSIVSFIEWRCIGISMYYATFKKGVDIGNLNSYHEFRTERKTDRKRNRGNLNN
ncbi:hypothetical protein D8674_006361 [Pyrus ussuriensis x Pyrus communis]|uniref:Uncharacterized protein n=1 Tax=Pyrus ussuriensis x Pyrus communis TaxID=2448454 RepID=A0A5N5G7R7_9ROSA|nr:hypothetical protein D8674_006361 [Pyrus ussuriensis x Pyrus communis]